MKKTKKWGIIVAKVVFFLIKKAFFMVKDRITEDDIQREKASVPQFLCEKNALYIEETAAKKHRPSAYRSLVGLRLLGTLTEELGICPSILRDENGRPYFKDTPHLDFNISHSNSMVACAVCLSDEFAPRVGIDCEEIYGKDPTLLAERYFTEKERDFVLSAENKAYAFTEIWTKKEAYLKHLGTGLSRSPRFFDTLETELHFETFEKENNLVTLCYDIRLK